MASSITSKCRPAAVSRRNWPNAIGSIMSAWARSCGNTHSVTVRRYFGGSDSYAEVGANEGHSQVAVGPVDVERRRSRSFDAKVSAAVAANFVLAASWHYEDDAELPIGKGFSLELVARW